MISLIVAMTEDRVIGRDNKLPWHISEDLARFKRLTMDHAIIMGRKTFDSIGKALPGRQNIVVTRNPNWRAPGVETAGSLAQAYSKVNRKDEVFVIGGSSLFEEALPSADKLYLTLVHAPILGDTYFPPLELNKRFEITEQTRHKSAKGDNLDFSFITAIRS
jgi:dihydrofolate reductase